MAIVNSYVELPEGIYCYLLLSIDMIPTIINNNQWDICHTYFILFLDIIHLLL